MCAAGLYDVLMPDIKYAGGYRGMLEIARGLRSGTARHFRRTIRPVPSRISRASICAPRRRRLLWLEHQWDESPLFDSLVGGACGAARRRGIRRARRSGARRDTRSRARRRASLAAASRERESRPTAWLIRSDASMSELFPGFTTRRIATSGRRDPLRSRRQRAAASACCTAIRRRTRCGIGSRRDSRERFTVVCADLRGYGDSSKPDGGAGHVGYSKRAMAQDQVEVMQALGFTRFRLVGHDRGGARRASLVPRSSARRRARRGARHFADASSCMPAPTWRSRRRTTTGSS